MSIILIYECTSIHNANSNETGSPHLKERYGTLRTFEALRAGIHPRTLYALRDSGEIEQLARGLFRLAELPPPGEPDLLTVAEKVPQAVFCLLTALAFHRLTTQVPHAVDVALPRTARVPRLNHPPIKVFRFFPNRSMPGSKLMFSTAFPSGFTAVKRLWPITLKYRNKGSVSMSHLKPSGLTDLSRNGTFKRR